MDRVSLTAEPRTVAGSAPARRIRRAGRVPAIVYGKGDDAFSISVDSRDLFAALRTEAGLNALIDLKVDGAEHLTVAREIQRHPLRDEILHLDFVKISLTDRIEAEVAIDFTGTPLGVSEDGGIFETVRATVTVEALPTEIPAAVEVEIGQLRIGDSLSLADLPDLEGVGYVDDPETTIATVVAPRIEVEPEVPEEELELEEGVEVPEEAAEEAEGAPAEEASAEDSE